jgi:hypothetical protein
MSEMIERVARAICEAERMNPDDALGGWVHWRDAARAAIEEMREPTEGMADAAYNAGHHGDMTSIWRAMAAAAISPALDQAIQDELDHPPKSIEGK